MRPTGLVTSLIEALLKLDGVILSPSISVLGGREMLWLKRRLTHSMLYEIRTETSTIKSLVDEVLQVQEGCHGCRVPLGLLSVIAAGIGSACELPEATYPPWGIRLWDLAQSRWSKAVDGADMSDVRGLICRITGCRMGGRFSEMLAISAAHSCSLGACGLTEERAMAVEAWSMGWQRAALATVACEMVAVRAGIPFVSCMEGVGFREIADYGLTGECAAERAKYRMEDIALCLAFLRGTSRWNAVKAVRVGLKGNPAFADWVGMHFEKRRGDKSGGN